MTATRPSGVSRTANTTSTVSVTGGKLQCRCGHPATRLVSKTEKNPGRPFYQCYKGRDDLKHCKFFAWEDMVPGLEASSEKTPSKTNPASPSARYTASLAAKASPIPKAGNYSKAFGGTTHGYTLAGGPIMKPITSIPHPLHPNRLPSEDQHVPQNHDTPHIRTHTTDLAPDSSQDEAKESTWRPPATPDDMVEVPTSQLPDMTVGAGWNSAKKRAMAKKRREMIMRALKQKGSEGSSTDEVEVDAIENGEQQYGGADSIETFEPIEMVAVRQSHHQQQQQKSDDFDSGSISWDQIDADAIEASASQLATRTPRGVNVLAGTISLGAETSPSLPSRTTFMDRLNAVNNNDPLDTVTLGTKKRKRHHPESDGYSDTNYRTSSVHMDVATSTPYASARGGTLTPPDTRECRKDRRRAASELQGASSAILTDGLDSASEAAYASLSVPGVGMGATLPVHPFLEALNRDLLKRDRKAAADEKSREMLRGRVKALEARVRELEGELRRATSERR